MCFRGMGAGARLRQTRSAGLRRPDKRAHELSGDINGLRIDASAREQGSRVVFAVDARRFDAWVFEANFAQELRKLEVIECARDATCPQVHAPPDSGGNLTVSDDVAHREPAARLQYAERFGKDCLLVAGKVDDAIGDDDVDGARWQRDGLDVAAEKPVVGDAASG